jgi:hypothetical protein
LGREKHRPRSCCSCVATPPLRCTHTDACCCCCCCRFTVRVFVPCYAEALAVVSATVTAAMEADLPPGEG